MKLVEVIYPFVIGVWMASSINVEFSVAKPEDYDSVRDFVLKYYYADEPLNTSYVYGSEPAEDDVEFSLSFLLQNMAVKATDGERLVGVSIANPVYPDYLADLLKAAEVAETRKWRDNLLLLAHLQRSANVLERFKVDRCYDIEILAVHPDYRGLSIGRKLFEEQFRQGKRLGYPLASADCSSYYSARIAERVGMESVARLAYAEYRDESGVQLFQPEAPHLEVQTFVKVL